jgi:hypothetical protein
MNNKWKLQIWTKREPIRTLPTSTGAQIFHATNFIRIYFLFFSSYRSSTRFGFTLSQNCLHFFLLRLLIKQFLLNRHLNHITYRSSHFIDKSSQDVSIVVVPNNWLSLTQYFVENLCQS